MRFKQLFEIAVGHVIGEVADVQFLGHDGPPSEKIMRDDPGPLWAEAVA